VFNVASHFIIRVLEKLAALVGLGSNRVMRLRRIRFLRRVARLNRFVRTHPDGVALYLHRSDAAKFRARSARTEIVGWQILSVVFALAAAGLWGW
jgi:hypothetical protein